MYNLVGLIDTSQVATGCAAHTGNCISGVGWDEVLSVPVDTRRGKCTSPFLAGGNMLDGNCSLFASENPLGG